MARHLLVIAVIASSVPAWAEEEWAQGVSPDRQAKARTLFSEANQLFASQAHAPALEKYQAAIALWDHPMIRFNMAVTLVRLDRILEAAESLDRALHYGAKPFALDPDRYQQALDYQRLVAGRIGTIEASCNQNDANVMLDGTPWFSCPGARTRRVLVGSHAIVAEKAGHMTVSRRIVIEGGQTVAEKLKFVPFDSVATYEYPTARWIPWTTAAVGAAVAAGGLGLWVSARGQMDRFHTQFSAECPTGCEADLLEHASLADQRDGAIFKGRAGVSLIIAGGAVAVGGVLWGTVLNRPRRLLPTVEAAPTPGGAVAHASWRF